MKKFLVRSSAAAFAALVLALSGCGGGGGGGVATTTPETPTTPTTPTASVAQVLATAAGQASNDTSANSTASFTVLQGAGVPVVTVKSPPKVNFAVFSDGKLKTDLKLTDVSFALAKLVPGTNGEPDQWVNYVYRKETATAGVGPNGTPALASAMQATTDPKQTDTALAAAQLVLNADGYYTYTFKTDIKDPTQTNGVSYEPSRTHRVVIQLSYVNAAGTTVRVNPYFDFTLDSNGNSVAATAAQTRKMVDVNTCNNCHDKLALHGGGRVDTQYCVTCHNPGTKDANSGNVLTLSTMVHKIHAGKLLASKGEDYTIWGFSNSKHDYAEVGFPQPIRNCVACHDGSNPATPQGDNWKSVPSKEACLSCHQTGVTSGFYTKHVTTLNLGTSVDAIPNSTCASCHGAGGLFNAEKVHWIQELAQASLYQAKIDSITIKKAATSTAAGTMTVKVSVINPATGTPYDLREGCGTTCNTNYRWDVNGTAPTDKFGMFSVYLGTETFAPTLDDVTDTSSAAPANGVNDGSNHFSVDLKIPAGAHGNARVLLIGGVSERRLDPVTRAVLPLSSPPKPDDFAYVPVKNAVSEVNVGTAAASTTPRRAIVSNDGCNKCHGLLGLPMADQVTGFHKGHRNNAEACSVCHNANQAGTYTLMADGSTGPVAGDSSRLQIPNYATSNFLHESWQAKRFVHGIHYGEMRTYPFTHCMTAGGVYNKDGTSTTAGSPSMSCTQGSVANFTAEVAYPGALKACSNCHVNDSWKQDRSVMGSVVFKPLGTVLDSGVAGSATKPLDWLVMSPKVATCTTCHDAQAVKNHVTTIGAGAFGTVTQGALMAGQVIETCDGCHVPGNLSTGVDIVHTFK